VSYWQNVASAVPQKRNNRFISLHEEVRMEVGGALLHKGDIVGKQYHILDNTDSTEPPNEFARPVGRGASASVYKCSQDIGGTQVMRALKLMSPTKDLQEKRAKAGLSYGTTAFGSEIKNLASLNHQNIVRIIDAGKHDDRLFFVMDLVAGVSLQQLIDNAAANECKVWIERINKDPFILVRMIRQVTWALAYLHDREFYHMDVAPKNIFLSEVGAKPYVVLGDLGVGQFLRVDDPDSEQLVPVAGTREFAPPCVHEKLNGGQLPLGVLRKMAPYWDLFSVAKTFLKLADKLGLRKHSQLEPIFMLSERIIESDKQLSVAMFADELGRLMPDKITVFIPELSSGMHQPVPIPLCDVTLSKRVTKITSHEMFSRLRLIPQLLLVRTMFPGGVHTRFEHALGSYELARRVLLQLINQPIFLVDFQEKQLEEVLLATLLAHLEVYPLHHVVREAFPDAVVSVGAGGGLCPTSGAACPTSGAMSVGSGDALYPTFNWFLDYTGDGDNTFPSLRSVINTEFPKADLEVVASVLSKQTASEEKCVKTMRYIVGSSVDVRVMDYLRRDAHHTGANTGTNVDIEQIIKCLTVSAIGNIGISRAGVHAVENLLCARYWMYARVYWGPVNRSLFSMLTYVVTTLVKANKTTVPDLIKASLFLDEFAMLAELERLWGTLAKNPIHASLLPLLRKSRPVPYSSLTEFAEHDDGTPPQLINRYRGFSTDELRSRQDKLRLLLMKKYGITASEGDILIDIPRETVGKLGEDINLILSDHNEKSLQSSSKIVEALPEAFKTSAIKLRVFWSPHVKKQLSSIPEDMRRVISNELAS
jgi:HD superfamily phosphohydrolase/tRNA A-37 threonylcarbamoyl transferase component Bud32